MSITLDVNAFLNNSDACSQTGFNGGADNASGISGDNIPPIDDISMEKEMESNGNIFDEIEHLLKFNKNLEFPEAQAISKETSPHKQNKLEDEKVKESFSLDFLPSHTEDFLLASDTQSLLGEDPLLFCVEQDRLQPLSSRFMVPGIYKRIEGVERTDRKEQKSNITNVFVTNVEKSGRILRESEFQRVYVQGKYLPNTEDIKETKLESKVIKEKGEQTTKATSCNEIDKAFKLPTKNVQELDALHRLASDLLKLRSRDHIVIDRKSNEIVKTQYDTNQKTIYRLSQPESMGLKAPNLMADIEKRNNSPEELKNGLHTTKKDQQRKKKIIKSKTQKVLNIKENQLKSSESIENPNISKPEVTLNQTRTRSGRLVKIPQRPNTLKADAAPLSPKESLTDILLDLKDTSYHNKTHIKKDELTPSPLETNEEPPVPLENNEASPPKRKVPPEAICPTCHKIFLGKRLQRHFAQHPDHIKVPTTTTTTNKTDITINTTDPPTNLNPNTSNDTNNIPSDDISLFRFLVNKLHKSQNLNEDQKADLFLNELNDLVDQLHVRSSRLIRNTSGLHLVNQKCAKILGIPEGQYALDLSAIEGPLEPEMQDNNNTAQQTSVTNHLNSRCLDITNLSITLDDTLTDEAAQKLNLSAGGKLLPPSEESLLRAVGDLVQTDITKLQSNAPAVCSNDSASTNKSSNVVVEKLLPPHIDHVSDNAVEAVHMKETQLPNVVVNSRENPLLDLSVDFFQFNN